MPPVAAHSLGGEVAIAASKTGGDPFGAAIQAGLSLLGQVGSGGKPSPLKTAASSIVITGEPISSAILTAGNFALQTSAQKKAAKQDRLLASTARDMGITQDQGDFISQFFAAGDPDTFSLLKMVDSDLAITDPKFDKRGDNQYAISLRAGEVLAKQINSGAVRYLPDPSEYLGVGGQIGGIVERGLHLAALERTGKTSDDLYRDKYGHNPVGGVDTLELHNFLFGLLGLPAGGARLATTSGGTYEIPSASGGIAAPSGASFQGQPQTLDRVVVREQVPAGLLIGGAALLGLVLIMALRR